MTTAWRNIPFEQMVDVQKKYVSKLALRSLSTRTATPPDEEIDT